MQTGVDVAYLQCGGMVDILTYLALISIFQGDVGLVAFSKIQHEQEFAHFLKMYLRGF